MEQTATPAKKRFWSKKRVIIAVLLSPLVALLCFVAYQAFFYFNPYLRINFTTFKPQGYEIIGEKLTISTPEFYDIDTVAFPRVWISFDFKDSGIGASMAKANPTLRRCINIFPAECFERITPKNQKYLLGVDEFSDGATTEWVSFIKSGTRIVLSKDATITTPTPESEWHALIDSFEPAHFPDLPVRRFHPGA